MKHINIKDAKKNFNNLLQMCLFNGEIIKMHCKEDNVILMSKDYYESLLNSIYLFSCKGVLDDINEAKNTSSKELILKAPWDK